MWIHILIFFEVQIQVIIQQTFFGMLMLFSTEFEIIAYHASKFSWSLVEDVESRLAEGYQSLWLFVWVCEASHEFILVACVDVALANFFLVIVKQIRYSGCIVAAEEKYYISATAWVFLDWHDSEIWETSRPGVEIHLDELKLWLCLGTCPCDER